MRRQFINLLFLLNLVPILYAQPQAYTLEQCREMALNNSNGAKMEEEAKLAAEYTRKAALAAMMPRLTTNASYMWNSRDAHLLANQTTLPIGTTGVGADGSTWFEWGEDADWMKAAQQLQGLNAEALSTLKNQAGQAIADTYGQLYDAFTVDMTHVLVAQVGLTQPIYTGGRLRELYRITQSAEKMVQIESDCKKENIIVSVDEAYWRVVSVEHKHRLAHNYYDLLVTLENNVQELVAEGICTQSDLLKVTAKRGEAEVKKLQADNGLLLAKMALCQACGLPLDTDIHPNNSSEDGNILAPEDLNTEETVANRSELRMLQEAENIARSNIRIMAAGLQPNIVASASYIYTNPYASNGLSNDWQNRGFFSVGVVVNIPIAHADDILRLKAAKHEAEIVTLKKEEARGLLQLQTVQAKQRLLEANQKVALAELNKKNCEEVMRMADESFQAGVATASDLLQAQTAWLSASTDLVDARVNAQVCKTYLNKYIGQL